MTDCKKTKLDKVLEFLKYLLKFLDNNKTESVIFFLGIALSLNVEKVKLLIGWIF